MSERKIENSRVLVTGGAGFIGSNLCEMLLEQNNEVVCLDNFATGKRENVTPFLRNNRFKLVEGDIRNLSDCKRAIDGADYVLHQAALGSVPRSIDDPITTNSVNVTGFLNMLVSARDAKVKRMVFATSSSVYGNNQDMPKLEENTGRQLSPYAISKYVNELYAGVFHDVFDLEVIGLRYFNVFGRRQDPNGAYAAAIPRFVQAFMSYESPVIFGDGTQSRDFTYIDNVLQANQLAALSPAEGAIGEMYNVANGASTDLNTLVGSLRTLLAEFDPAIADVSVEYGPIRIGDVKNSQASIAKAQAKLGYNPTDDITSGLSKAINWYWERLGQKAGSLS